MYITDGDMINTDRSESYLLGQWLAQESPEILYLAPLEEKSKSLNLFFILASVQIYLFLPTNHPSLLCLR